jgi:hypothetical protein
VQLEWHTLGGDFEIEVQPSGTVSALFSRVSDGAEIESEEFSLGQLRSFLQQIAS